MMGEAPVVIIGLVRRAMKLVDPGNVDESISAGLGDAMDLEKSASSVPHMLKSLAAEHEIVGVGLDGRIADITKDGRLPCGVVIESVEVSGRKELEVFRRLLLVATDADIENAPVGGEADFFA